MRAATISDRISSLIRAAAIEHEPTENIFLNDVFAPEIYAELLARLPSDEAMDNIDHPDAHLPDGRITRKLLDVTEKTIPRFAAEDQPFWHELREALTSQTMVRALQDKFRATLSKRFGDTLPEMLLTPMLLRDWPGYFISVHPDSPKKVVTMQFYFPPDDSQAHLGTTFHRREGDAFPEIKTNVFKPNAAYAFARTDESWHSVKPIGPNEKTRNSMALILFIAGEEYRSPRP